MGSDRILEAARRGDRAEMIRLIAELGVWIPFRDLEYFDTADCLPVFSSPDLIPKYLEIRGIEGELGHKITAQRLGPALFQFSPHHRSNVLLNPGSESEMKLTEDEFDFIESYEQLSGACSNRTNNQANKIK